MKIYGFLKKCVFKTMQEYFLSKYYHKVYLYHAIKSIGTILLAP